VQFSVYTEKEKIAFGEDSPTVVLNLCLPRVREESRLTKGFTAYYNALRAGFLQFAEGTLQKKAKGERGEDFKPYGAVLSAITAYDGEGLISLYVDASVTVDDKRRVSRISQLWRKDIGTIVKSAQFFRQGWVKRIKPLLVNAAAEYCENAATPLFADWEKQVRDRFCKEQFYLTPKGAAFYYQPGDLSPAAKCVPLHLTWDCLLPLVKPSVSALLPKEP